MPGWHSRGFPAIPVCTGCKEKLETGDHVEFTSKVPYHRRNKSPEAAHCLDLLPSCPVVISSWESGLPGSVAFWGRLDLLAVLPPLRAGNGCYPHAARQESWEKRKDKQWN